VTLDPDKWRQTVANYQRLDAGSKALVLDLDSFYSYWSTDERDPEATALANCRGSGRLKCATAYRNNQSVLDVTPYLTSRGGGFTMGDFAQAIGAFQAGLSGGVYTPPPPLADVDDDDDDDEPAQASAPSQDCLPNPPQCASVGARGKNYMANAEARLRAAGVPAAGMAGMQAYCVNRLTAEIARVCANEYRSIGKQSCANLARAQMDENLRVAEGARRTVLAYTSGAWQEDCGW
jgi:hypothetical protein